MSPDEPRNGRSPEITAPTQAAISFRGEKVTPLMILRSWRDAMRAKPESRKRILKVRAMRRKEQSSLPRVNRKWARKFPEAAALARLTCEERITLEQDMIASVGVAEPNFECEPLGFREGDGPRAESEQAYLNEWRRRSVPTQAFAGKNVEDGEFGCVVMPCDLDMDGAPDYFEYIDEAAYKGLDKEGRDGYGKDTADRRQRYRKLDADKKPMVKDRYASMLKEPAADAERPSVVHREKARDARHKAAQQAHEEDVTQYILRKQLDASAIRLIPALDCAPVFKRGRKKDRWELVCLVERVLYEPWELIADGINWQGMGDRLLVPQGYSTEDVGVNGQVYVYTMYLTVTEKDKDGIPRTHPLICMTVGGAGTSDGGLPDDPDSVMVIDLYEEYGIEGQNFGYFGGLHGEDDSPDHYWRPLMWAVLDRLKAIEGNEGAIRATTSVQAFTGHVVQIDARWAQTEEGIEAIFDTGGNLRKTTVPGPGEVADSIGAVAPWAQSRVGADAWNLLASDKGALEKATAIDQAQAGPNTTGHALLVQTTLGQVAKRQIRDGVLAAVVFCGEVHLRILHAIYERYGIKWPIRTTQQRPVGGEKREGRAPAIYDPDWVADGQFNLFAKYPEEEQLARIDQEANLAERGFGNSDRVLAAMGEQDPEAARLKADKDALMKEPFIKLLRMKRVAKRIGDKELEDLVELQAAQLMAPDVPGIPGGVPNDALKREGEAQGGGAGTSPGAQIRGGITGAAQTGSAMQANAQAAVGGAAA